MRKWKNSFRRCSIPTRAMRGINFIDVTNLPMRDKILETLELLLEVLFPGYTGKRPVTKSNVGFVVGDILCQAHDGLVEQIERAYRHACRMKKCPDCDCRTMAADSNRSFVQ